MPTLGIQVSQPYNTIHKTKSTAQIHCRPLIKGVSTRLGLMVGSAVISAQDSSIQRPHSGFPQDGHGPFIDLYCKLLDCVDTPLCLSSYTVSNSVRYSTWVLPSLSQSTSRSYAIFSRSVRDLYIQ